MSTGGGPAHSQFCVTDTLGSDYDFAWPCIGSKAAPVLHKDDTSIRDFAGLSGRKVTVARRAGFAQLTREYRADVVSVEPFDKALDFQAGETEQAPGGAVEGAAQPWSA